MRFIEKWLEFEGDDKTSRIQWIDIVKGIAILLMLIGHMVEGDSQIRKMIYSFHMPLFVIINGYLIRKYDFFKTIRRSCKTLLIPYLFVRGCIIVLSVVLKGWDLRRTLVLIRDTLAGMSKVGVRFGRFTCFQSVGAVWFLPCLFLSRNIFVLLMSIGRKKYEKKKWMMIMVLTMSLLGAYLGNHYAYFPWSADVAFYSLIFLGVGNEFKKRKIFDTRPNRLTVFLALLIWLTLLAMDMQIELAKRWYPVVFGGALCAVAGSYFVIVTGIWLEKKKGRLAHALEWCGINSLLILGVHVVEMWFVDWDDLFGNGEIIKSSSLLGCTLHVLFTLIVAIVLRLLLNNIMKVCTKIIKIFEG